MASRPHLPNLAGGHLVHTFLIWQVGTNVNAVDEDGKTVLCVAACSLMIPTAVAV